MAAASESGQLAPFQTGKVIVVPKCEFVPIADFVTVMGRPPSVKTVSAVYWDEIGLTISFECEDPRIVAKQRPRNDPDIQKDDRVEVYLDVGHTHGRRGWIHVIVSAAGSVLEEKGRDKTYRAKGLKAIAEATEGGWRVEIRLLWSDIGVAPVPGDVWGFNLNRCEHPDEELLCLSPTGGAFAEVHRWGHLVFGDTTGRTFSAMQDMANRHEEISRQLEAVERKAELDTRPFKNLRPGVKTRSVFCGPGVIETAKSNADRYPWAAHIRDELVRLARPWLEMDDEQLWSLMFGPTITRSWDVWYTGHCPECKRPVVMYNWKINALEHPWKVQCPNCGALFPKNDFHAFYRSGLNRRGVFDPQKADRSLLFNAEHPDPDDPLHLFGVDDGEGYADGEKRWRFIGAYLIYGQWKQLVVGGIDALSLAYAATGDARYAHKTGILLDRVADLYGDFDYITQALTYGRAQSNGYVSMWHDANPETRSLALAYDRVFDAIKADDALVAFGARKAADMGLENGKESFGDIQRNIEQGILIDALNNYAKIHSNYPRTQVTQAIMKAVLSWPGDREEIFRQIDHFLDATTAVDGVTGEKGLPGYSAYVLQALGRFLALFARIEPSFLPELIARRPALRETFRFHMDTWCLGKYYPQCGDAGWFARRWDRYVGATFHRVEEGRPVRSASQFLFPSTFSLFWRMYEATGDADYVRVLYKENGASVAGLPHDLWASNPEKMQQNVRKVIDEQGAELRPASVNKKKWHLAILRSGKGRRRRAVWLDYDAGGPHGHLDGMNLGLFAFGLNLMPDLGYPPLQYGSYSPKVNWYKVPASHNTVVIDAQEQSGHYLTRRTGGLRAGETTLWCPGGKFQAIRAAGAEIIDGKQYERTVALVDVSDRASYVLDIFRVIGGGDHAKFMHSHFGTVQTDGLTLKPAEDYGHGTQMRNFRVDRSPPAAWSVDWKIEDRYGLLRPERQVRLRYTDLTRSAHAYICEGWVVPGHYSSTAEAWIPRIMVRRTSAGTETLASTFVAVIEPYETSSAIRSIRRLDLKTPAGKVYGDQHVALELELADGRQDLIVAIDLANPTSRLPDWRVEREVLEDENGLRTDAELAWIRRDAGGRVRRLVFCRARELKVGDVAVRMNARAAMLELVLEDKTAFVVSGPAKAVRSVTVGGAEWPVTGP